jgi:toxin ParE1/3/4
MSARRVEVQLSRSALRDVDDIFLHTRRTWGDRQRANYRAAIYRALDLLSRYPESGRPRDDRFPGCRSIQVEQHVVYFHQPRPGEIEVLRILHQRQDASAVVKDPSQ